MLILVFSYNFLDLVGSLHIVEWFVSILCLIGQPNVSGRRDIRGAGELPTMGDGRNLSTVAPPQLIFSLSIKLLAPAV